MTLLTETEELVGPLSAEGKARSTVAGAPLSPDELSRIDAYWRACKYLALGMIYLQANPLLREPLKPEHIKSRLLGHWGSSPGLAFIYTHLSRLIKKDDLEMIFLAGPGHGAPGVLGPVYLEGTYSEIYPEKSGDEKGLREFFKQFSFPGGIGSHCTPETPGSIHEGGELGYVLSHACGAAFDNPELIVAAVVGHVGPWWSCARQRVGEPRWKWTDIGWKASGVRIRFRWRKSRGILNICAFWRTGCVH
jgi:xylulose-5-phosphate/fructose-6-phosphate phosphoketolase